MRRRPVRLKSALRYAPSCDDRHGPARPGLIGSRVRGVSRSRTFRSIFSIRAVVARAVWAWLGTDCASSRRAGAGRTRTPDYLVWRQVRPSAIRLYKAKFSMTNRPWAHERVRSNHVTRRGLDLECQQLVT